VLLLPTLWLASVPTIALVGVTFPIGVVSLRSLVPENLIDNRNNTDDLLVAGIGASAGGLEAFSEVLSHLPADTGMAFVLVQHLAPDRESLLDELLNRTTEIPVLRAEHGMTVAANRVYVIPPGTQMTIAQGRLQLAERQAGLPQGKVVDTFFTSLAEDRKNKAIAIVLSGSNDDGAVGIRAVCDQGGITFAQDRATTEFPEMPSAAIATGQVDFVLPPAKIAEELVKISQHPYVREPKSSEAEEDIRFEDGDLAMIFRQLHKHTGVDFSQYKRTTFERRMRRRMALNKLPHLTDYIEYLKETPQEVQALYQDVLITVTNFFRDAELFAALQAEVLPALFQEPSAADNIRIWTAGCATGEETYSIAMGLLECLDTAKIKPSVQIFGTDVSDEAIETARSGLYPADRMAEVSTERRERFFTEVDGGFQIKQSVRELCIFAKHDLSSDPPFSEIDLLTCRNVLIYFQSSLQRNVLSLFHYSLKPTGLLVLGNSETVGEASNLFKALNPQHKIFRREAVPSQVHFNYVGGSYPRGFQAPQQPDFSAPLKRSTVQQWADQILLNRYAPVGVIINEKLDIIQFRGETSPFLRPPLGEPSFNLMKMLRPSLITPVRQALEQAQQRCVAIKQHDLQLEESPASRLTLEVIPFNVAQSRCCLVLFEMASPAPPDAEAIRAWPEVRDDLSDPEVEVEVVRLQREVATLRQELLDAQAFLQMTIEEQEATHQQLVAANEEVLSSNEELRSMNEELQTAKEEIQSANEELKTTNEELQSRHVESRRANDDLLNLVNNVNIPILMLSGNLHIRSFSPAARQMFNLIPTDVGRPISNIRPEVNLPELEPLVQHVVETLFTVEQEVQDQEGRWYLLRVRPYRTVENRIDGAVLTLIDIDTMRRTEEELRHSRTELERELLVTEQMRRLSLQLFESLDLDQALNEVLDAAIALLKADMGNVQIYDTEQDVLLLTAQRSLTPAFLEIFAEVDDTDHWASSRALRSRRRIVIEDVQTDRDYAPYREIAAAAGYRAVQATPLLNRQGEVLGVLSTYFRQPYRPSERELQLLDIYTRQASEFIQLVRAEKERQHLIEKAQAARAENASKDEFLSVLSHELRTPLNSILGWTQLFEMGQLSETDRERAIATIRNSAQVQLQLIEDLLDASRIIQNQFHIARQPTHLTAVIERAIALMRPEAQQKRLQLHQELEPSPELLSVDPQRLEQVFQNLLSNAVKFTPEGGQITVRLTYGDAHIAVQISDTGIGIDPDFLPHVFEQFRQADATNTRRHNGLGLGLFLIRSIVEAHEGTVQVTSPGVGQGTTFTVTLPRTPAETTAPPSVPSLALAALSLEGITLLLIDDDEANLELYTYYLEDLGPTVLVAQSAADALALLEQETVDLIISDIGLPGMNGYDFIQEVRSRPAEAGGNIFAIALSGYASQSDIQAALDAGFQLHLAKPVDLEELAIAIYSLSRD